MNNTITDKIYDESIELLEDVIHIIQIWDLNGKSNYDFIDEDDEGYDEIKDDYDEYCDDMSKIGDLQIEWSSHYHDLLFPNKKDDWENKHLENHYDEYKTQRLIERIEELRNKKQETNKE